METKNVNVLADTRNFFDQPIKNYLEVFDNIRKIAAGQVDDYTAGCLLDYPCFKKCYESIAIDLSKQQKLDADPNAIKEINFIGNLDKAEGATIFFIMEDAKETVLYFPKGTVNVLSFYFVFI